MPCYKEGDCWQIDYCVSSSLGKMKRWNPMVQNAGVKHMAKEIRPIKLELISKLISWIRGMIQNRKAEVNSLRCCTNHLTSGSPVALQPNRTECIRMHNVRTRKKQSHIYPPTPANSSGASFLPAQKATLGTGSCQLQACEAKVLEGVSVLPGHGFGGLQARSWS
jgi:hypothetical protein